MKRGQRFFVYAVSLGAFLGLSHWISTSGRRLEAGRNLLTAEITHGHWSAFVNSLGHNLKNPLAILLAQITVILLVTRVFAWICRKINQPTVIGEILAGIVLGPSLASAWFPEFSRALFPEGSLNHLRVLSEFGLILFMFVTGMEIDLKAIGKKASDSVVISHASIIVPFVLGMGLAYFIYPSFAPRDISFFTFSLFIGIAMSITAFPVLARIVQERGISTTLLGTMVITCAAVDDITAWCLLAALVAFVKAGSFTSVVYIMLLTLTYVLLMLKVVRPVLHRVGQRLAARPNPGAALAVFFFLPLFLSAFVTEVIGIHALFGAFMAGAVMPQNVKLKNAFVGKVQDVSLVVLLPLFFALTGLRTRIGLLDQLHAWQLTGVIILVAVVGKFAGSAVAARLVGQTWRNSLMVGALMNTRGLMELVVLNIGYDLGILRPEVFSMMVIMALATTCMTGPVLSWIDTLFGKPEPVSSHLAVPEGASPARLG